MNIGNTNFFSYLPIRVLLADRIGSGMIQSVNSSFLNKPQSVQSQPHDTKVESTRLYMRCILAPHFGCVHFGCLISGMMDVYNFQYDKTNRTKNKGD